MSELNFDEIQFIPDPIEDGFLELEEGAQLEESVFDIPVEDSIEVNTMLRPKDSSEVAGQVEDTLISLLESEDLDAILALTGEKVSSVNIPEDVLQNFGQMYAQAVLYNPAIRWYSKFVNMLESGGFFIQGGSLNLKLTPQIFKKIVLPFVGDFRLEFREDSPIVDLIYSIMENLQESEVGGKMKEILEMQKKSEILEEEGLGIEKLNFEELAMDTTNADLEVDENDDMGGGGVVFKDNKSPISMLDLANKTIAEYCIKEGILEESSIKEKLSGEGFSKGRANEILGIIKYISLNTNLNKPEGNVNTGFVDFDFS